jgi:putative transposase
MSRPMRLEFQNALYHVTSRGNAQQNIYLSDTDRQQFLNVLEHVIQRYNWVVHAYCLMSNHYHLLIETPDGNLSKGMRQLNGLYTQDFNRAHKRVGHVYQGRYKAILVEKQAYLLELARYIVLNPVRAEMVRSAKDWKWSSYRTTADLTKGPNWLATDWLLSQFAKTKKVAIRHYREFVKAGKNQPSPMDELKNQVYLGGAEFVEEMQEKLSALQADTDADLSEVPRVQRRLATFTLQEIMEQNPDRNTGILQAYQTGQFSMKEVGLQFGLHYSRISRIVKSAEGKT